MLRERESVLSGTNNLIIDQKKGPETSLGPKNIDSAVSLWHPIGPTRKSTINFSSNSTPNYRAGVNEATQLGTEYRIAASASSG